LAGQTKRSPRTPFSRSFSTGEYQKKSRLFWRTSARSVMHAIGARSAATLGQSTAFMPPSIGSSSRD
jgi:hypothetical protein